MHKKERDVDVTRLWAFGRETADETSKVRGTDQ